MTGLPISVGDIGKLCQLAAKVYKNCRDCLGDYKTLTSQARALTNLLEDIQDKYDKIPPNKRQQLFDAYEPCIDVLEELDKLVVHYNGLDTKSKRAWDRLTYDPDQTSKLRDRLVSSVSMLSAFYTSLIQDSQVLILGALERLERDYKGGHREESIASIERITSGTTQDGEEDDDAAWTQILRDLEDVGVSQQDALSYRDVIIDWLVTAVNEGRLLEERPEQDMFPTMSQDFGNALPPLEFTGWSQGLDVPVQGSSSAPSPVASPVASSATLPMLKDNPCYLSRSGILDCQSATSLHTIPRKSQSATSSLYALPESTSSVPVAPSTDSSTSAIGQFPIPSASATSHATLSHTLPEPPSYAPLSAPPPVPAVSEITDSVAPPSYYDSETSTTADLEWTSSQIIASWARNDFVAAGRYVEEHLAAIERGQTFKSGVQSDRRILRHLIGVCASLTGDFTKAKLFFESVFSSIQLSRQNLDQGDIAAARWLGDVCLYLREHENAALAYSVAYEGSLGRFGQGGDRTQQVASEILPLDSWLIIFKRIELLASRNIDPTNIFGSTDVVLKNMLITSVQNSVYDGRAESCRWIPRPGVRPSMTIGRRPQYAFQISKAFLLGPLVSLNTWPLPYDPMFLPMDVVQLDHHIDSSRLARITRIEAPLIKRGSPTHSLRNSKKLHYLTKRGSEWLIETVKRGLQDIGIEHADNPYDPSIVCCLHQNRNSVAFSEGVEICFWKLPFREFTASK